MCKDSVAKICSLACAGFSNLSMMPWARDHRYVRRLKILFHTKGPIKFKMP